MIRSLTHACLCLLMLVAGPALAGAPQESAASPPKIVVAFANEPLAAPSASHPDAIPKKSMPAAQTIWKVWRRSRH